MSQQKYLEIRIRLDGPYDPALPDDFAATYQRAVQALQKNGPPESYEGDEYFVGPWTAAGYTSEAAAEVAGDPMSLCVAFSLPGLGLQAILADKHVTRGLRKCLLEQPDYVVEWLGEYVRHAKRNRKPGPRPDVNGKYKKDLVAELRARKLSFGQIAKQVYGDANKRGRVSALLSGSRKKKNS